MKNTIKKYYILILLLLLSCINIEVLNAPNPKEVDTVEYKKMYLPPKDTIIIEDTTRVPIGFNPSVED